MKIVNLRDQLVLINLEKENKINTNKNKILHRNYRQNLNYDIS